MKRFNRELWAGAAAAAVAFLVVACGSTPTTTTGCTGDAECGTGKMCHPILKSCQTACTGSSECPSSAKTCATISGAAHTADAGVAAFCQCATDALCGSGQVCQSGSSKICTAKCTANADCGSGVTCDTTTGYCGSTVGVPDAGAGVCNSTTASEPSTCGYGNVCNPENGCDPLTDGTCSNITSATTHSAWSSTGTGPVIYNVVDEASNDNAACGGGAADRPATVTVYAYAATGMTFPAARANLPGFWYYKTDGSRTDAIIQFDPTDNTKGYSVSADGKNAVIRLTLCGSAVTPLPAAFGFTNGNGFCVNIAH